MTSCVMASNHVLIFGWDKKWPKNVDYVLRGLNEVTFIEETEGQDSSVFGIVYR